MIILCIHVSEITMRPFESIDGAEHHRIAAPSAAIMDHLGGSSEEFLRGDHR